jgi:hypothetical protein
MTAISGKALIFHGIATGFNPQLRFGTKFSRRQFSSFIILPSALPHGGPSTL